MDDLKGPMKIILVSSALSQLGDGLGEDSLQGIYERVAFGVGANSDAQAVVDARGLKVAHQDTGSLQFKVERFASDI